MTMREQGYFWGVFLLILGFVLWKLGAVITPFILGMAVAYFLDPAADRLEAWGLSRTLATVVITLGAFIVFGLILLLVGPLLVRQVGNLVADVPGYMARGKELLTNIGMQYFPESTGEASPVLDEALASIRDNVKDFSLALMQRSVSGVSSLMGFVSMLVIVPVVAFYMLLDWDRMIAAIDGWLPREHAPVIRRLAREIDRVLSGFVRGQLSVCLIMGAFYALGLSMIGLDYGLLIGFLAGMLSFIPYVGALFGGALSIGLAAAQFWGNAHALPPVPTDWLSIGLVAVVFFIGQMIEGNLLTPKLVGGSVGLHPVWLIFALSTFGALFGFLGLLIAVPVAASIGVLGRFAVEQYQGSRIYTGPPVSDNPDDPAGDEGYV